MTSLMLTLPLLPHKVEAWRRFMQTLQGSCRVEYETSRRRLGIRHEQFSLVETASGRAVLFTVQARDLGQALNGLASSQTAFDRWFRDRLRELHGFTMEGALPLAARRSAGDGQPSFVAAEFNFNVEEDTIMSRKSETEQFDTVVVGGGQAGLATGYYLARQGRDFVIVDGQKRVGDAWRKRWDSLRLFTPAEYNGLPGMDFPAPPGHLPTKDEMADYLEAYAERFELPVRTETWVKNLSRRGETYVLETGDGYLEARRVVVATGAYQKQRIPDAASELSADVRQIPSTQYRNPEQLPAGDVLVVGAGNSGAEIAMDVAQAEAERRVWLAGRDTGHMKRRILGKDIFWWLWRTIFRVRADSWLGRRLKKKMTGKGAPLLGLSEEELEAAGVVRVPRVSGVEEGKPLLEDGRTLDVATIIWATGFTPDFDWIELPVFGQDGTPVHHRGVVDGARGLYFIGLPFLWRGNSSLVGGVGADARHIATHIAQRASSRAQAAQTQTATAPTAAAS